MQQTSSYQSVKNTQTKKKFLSVNQKIGISVVVLLILILPILMYGVIQQTLLLSKANNQTRIAQTPTTPPVTLKFSTIKMGDKIKVTAKFGTEEVKVDGAQFVAYLDNLPGVFTINDTKFVATTNTNYNVVANSIEYKPRINKYQLSLAVISSNPASPLITAQGNTIDLGSFTINVLSSSDTPASLVFDLNKTKVIANKTGENIAIYQPSLNIDFSPNVPIPSETPVASPTSTPVPSGTPLPTPILEFNSTTQLLIKLQGYTGPNSVYKNIPGWSSVMWNPTTQRQLIPRLASVTTVKGNIYITNKYSVTKNTDAVFYYKPDKSLSVAVPVTLKPNSTTNIDLSRTAIKIGDIYSDNLIDIQDYHMLVTAFDPTKSPSPTWEDLNYDGIVDISDYRILADNFDILNQSPEFPY